MMNRIMKGKNPYLNPLTDSSFQILDKNINSKLLGITKVDSLALKTTPQKACKKSRYLTPINRNIRIMLPSQQ